MIDAISTAVIVLLFWGIFMPWFIQYSVRAYFAEKLRYHSRFVSLLHQKGDNHGEPSRSDQEQKHP